MKRILIIFMFGLSCSSSKKIESISSKMPSRVRELQIVFRVLSPDYSYQFSFLNKSQDTISIVMPQLYGPYSIFKLFDGDLNLLNRRCASIKYANSVEFFKLLPNKEAILEGELPLRKYFCDLNDNDHLGYFYFGMYKVETDKKIEEGKFSFEIDPIKIHTIDSIIINKKIF